MDTLGERAKPALGSPPTLARLAYSRLGFGARPETSDFGDDEKAFAAYLEQQLYPEKINDSACEKYVASINHLDDKGRTIPPLNATLKQITAYEKLCDSTLDFAPYWMTHQLQQATYARATFSQRQLLEVMVDFWTNHFNTLGESKARMWEDVNVIRKHALGNFKDLLKASAQSPAMLTYLSNAYSDGENPNENYGREIMELHTLGSLCRIPGHPRFGLPNYTEADVHAAAKMLSGWSLNFYNKEDAPNGDDSFRFNGDERWPRHAYEKQTLQLDNPAPTIVIEAGGIEQGEKLIEILATHENTAYFISWKLCKRLLSDAPQKFCPGAVQAGMNAFLNSSGDIKALLRAILLYREEGADFKSSWGQKLKRPFEFYVSMLRSLGVTTKHPKQPFVKDIEWETQLLGQELFNWSPPTGFPDVMRYWWNSNQLFARWTIANTVVMRFMGEQWWYDPLEKSDATLDALIGNPSGKSKPTAQQAGEKLMRQLWGVWPHEEDYTRMVNYLAEDGAWEKEVTSQHPRLRPLLGALLASPYFQLR